MGKLLSDEALASFHRQGYYFPVRAMPADEARGYRDQLQSYEATTGAPIQSNMRHKVHLLFTWANELIRHPKILDAVEDVIGPNIICWRTSFFYQGAAGSGLRLLASGFDLLGVGPGRCDHGLVRDDGRTGRKRCNEIRARQPRVGPDPSS